MVQREPWRIHERRGYKQANDVMNLKKILGILLEHMLGNISKNILYEESLRFPEGRILKMSKLWRFYTRINCFSTRSLMA